MQSNIKSKLRTIRVFISSTFKDMHSERDYLVKNVFPELRERCASKGLELVDVDLRWGVTEEEGQSGKALEICLEEIEKSRPFFIGLIGERYGWIPAPQAIPTQKYDQFLSMITPDEKSFLSSLFEKDSSSDCYFIKDPKTPKDENGIISIMEKYDFQPFDIPDGVSNEDAPSYEWIRDLSVGHSVTAMEIYHGVLNNPQMKHRAFFYFRDPSFIKDVPINKQAEVMVESSDARRKLASLKEAILKMYSESPANINRGKDGNGYSCQYAGLAVNWPQAKAEVGRNITEQDLQELESVAADWIVDNTEYKKLNHKQKEIIDKYGTVRLSGLEAFGDEVKKDLWHAIENEYPETQEAKDPLDLETEAQKWFAESRLKFFVGRQDILDELKKCQDGEENRPYFVFGEPGTGKSAIMAKMAQEYRKEGWWVFENYAGSTASSGNLLDTLERLMNTLCKDFGLKRHDEGKSEFLKSDNKNKDRDTLKEELQMLLSQAGKQKSIIIVFDAVNQFSSSELETEKLQWLPEQLPTNVIWVISAISGEIEDTAWIKGFSGINVGGIEPDCSKLIVETTLGEYRKKLNNEQMEHLLGKSDADKPLYLKIACEELRIYSRFELLTERIRQMSGNVSALIEEVLERIEQDNDKTIVRDALSLIKSSRNGLLESELLELLARDNDTVLPQAIWTKLHRGIKELISSDSEGLIRFYHQQMELAVESKYLNTSDVKKGYYKKLGDYAYHKFLIEAQKKDAKKIHLINTSLDCGGYLFNAEDKDLFLAWADTILNAAEAKREILNYSMDAQIEWMVQGNDKNEMVKWGLYFGEINEKIISLENGDYFYMKGLNKSRTVYYQWSVIILEFAIGIKKSLYEKSPDDLNLAEDLAKAYGNLGVLLYEINQKEEALKYCELAIGVQKHLNQRYPDDPKIGDLLATLYNSMGTYISDMNQEEALKYFELALGIRKPRREKYPDDRNIAEGLGATYNNLSLLLRKMNQIEKAIQYAELAIDLIEQNLNNFDTGGYYALANINLGVLLEDLNRKEEAGQLYERAIEILEYSYKQVPDDINIADGLLNAYGKIGSLLVELNRKEEAIPYYELAVEIGNSLYEKISNHHEIANRLATNCYELGLLLTDINRKEEAIRCYEIAIDISKHIYEKSPDNSDNANRLAAIGINLATLLYNNERKEEAIQYYELYIRQLESHNEESPSDFDDADILSRAYNKLGLVLDELNRKEEAARYYVLAIEIRESLYEQHPDDSDIADVLADIYSNLGLLLADDNQKEEAILFFEQAINIRKNLYEKDPDNLNIANRLCDYYYSVGVIMSRTAKGDQAYTMIREADRIAQETGYVEMQEICESYFQKQEKRREDVLIDE